MPVRIDASESVDRDGSIVRYEWELNGMPGWDAVTTVPYTDATFLSAGRFEVRLRVTDDLGATSTDKTWVRILADTMAPTAVINAPTSATAQEVVTLDGSGSYDPNGLISTYAWDFDNDGTVDSVGAAPTVDHAWSVAGVYTLRLTVTDATGKTGSATALMDVAGVPDTAPEAPTGVSAEDVAGDDGGAVQVTWLPNSEADIGGYRVYSAGTSSGPFTSLVAQTSNTSFTDTGLDDGSNYYYGVTAYDLGGNESALSPIAWATPIDDSAPDTPTGLSVCDVPDDDGDALSVTWAACMNQDLVGYRLTICDVESQERQTVDVPAGTNEHVCRDLVTGRTYMFTVRAYDAAGNVSAASANVAAVPTDELPPGPPTGMTAVDRPDDDGRAILTWWNAATEHDLAGYLVFRTTYPGGAPVQVADVTTTSWTDETCVDGVGYGYRVNAYDASGNISAGSDISIAQSFDTLPPLGVTAGAAADVPDDQGGAVKVTWLPSASTQAPTYRVDCCDINGAVIASAQGLTELTHTFAGLPSSVPLSFVVYAVDAAGNVSPASPILPATALDNLAPAAPMGLAAADVVPDQGGAIAVSWAASSESDLAGYMVRCYAVDGSLIESRDVGFATSPVFGGLAVGATHMFDVVAVDVNGNVSEATARVSAKGDDEVAPDPVSVNVTDKPGDQGGVVEIAWSACADADVAGYKVYRDHCEIADVTGTTYVDPVGDNAVHVYTICAYDRARNFSANDIEVLGQAVDNLAPAAPTAVSAVDAPDDDGCALCVTFTRSPDADVDAYRVSVMDGDGSLVSSAMLAALDEAATLQGLSAGTLYSVEIVAIDMSGNESVPTERVFAMPENNVSIPDTEAPSAPVLLMPSSGNSLAGFEWLPAPDNVGTATYEIWMKSGISGVWVKQADNPLNSYSRTGLVNGLTYYFKVRAADEAGNLSAFSNELALVPAVRLGSGTFRIQDNNPAVKYQGSWYTATGSSASGRLYDGGTVHYSTVGGARVALQFSGTGLSVRASGAAGSNRCLANVFIDGVYKTSVDLYSASEASVVVYEAYGLSDGQHQLFIDNSGTKNAASTGTMLEIDYFEVSGTVNDLDIISAPVGAAASDQGGDNGECIRVAWNANTQSDLAGYRIYRAPTASGPFTLVGEVGCETLFLDYGVRAGETHFYRVTAIDDSGNESAASNTTYANAVDDVAPMPPQGLFAQAGVVPGVVNLTWRANSEPDLARYVVYRSASNGAFVKIGESTEANFTDTGCQSGVLYGYRVTAVDVNGKVSTPGAAMYVVPGW